MTTSDIYGKLPPQSIESEEMVLGSILQSKEPLISSISFLRPEYFYKDTNGFIFSVIVDLFNKSAQVDMITVCDRIEILGKIDYIGGRFYISSLLRNWSVDIEFHCKIIVDKFLCREMIRICNTSMNESYQAEDIKELIDNHVNELLKVQDSLIKSREKTIAEYVENEIKSITKAMETKSPVLGISTGFPSIDNILFGFQPQDLIIIAARPSMGKTALIVSMACNMAINNKIRIGFFSLEMSGEQIVNRMLSHQSDISANDLKTGQIEINQYKHLISLSYNISDSAIYIDDTGGISVSYFRSKALRMKMKHNIDIIFLDYIQLMSGSKGKQNREAEISEISRSLKAIAKELNIPIVCLSQMNREIEKTTDKRPKLSYLRESGSIEQDADIIIFPHRPEYYGIETFDDGSSTSGIAEIIVAKNRNGAIGSRALKFIPQCAKFTEPNYIDF